MASREAVLADFQACTGIDDVGEAISQLEAADWSLVDAVNIAMAGPQPASAAPVPPVSIRPSPSIAPNAGEPMPAYEPFADNAFSGGSTSRYASAAGVTIADDMLAGSSYTAGQRTRVLEFSIQYNDRIIHLKVPDNEDLKTLKQLLSQETGFPPCQLELTGFRSSGSPLHHVSDRRRLSELNLPKENVLQLTTPTNEENGEMEAESEQDNSDFKLIITNVKTNEVYKLNFRPTQNVLSVKLGLTSLTSIPVSRQKWTGWPDHISDELTLAQIGIPREHHLTLDELPKPGTGRDMPIIDLTGDDATAGPSSRSSRQPESSDIEPDVDTDDDDFVDASDMMDDDDIAPSSSSGNRNRTRPVGSRIQPLLPDDYGSDESMAAIKFSQEFANRYGRPHPHFFPGSLDDAIKEACMKPAKERKMLAVYLHHDSSVLTNVFCTQVLCADSVVSFLKENFVTFGWDLTHNSNKQRAVNMITRHFGSVTASSVRNMDIERFPIIALTYRLRGATEIFEMFHGNLALDEVMSRLLSAHETYCSQLAVEAQEEQERAEREAMKREQDLAYEMSLQADREKEAQRKRDEEERLEQERLDAAIKKSREEEQLRKELEKQQRQDKIKKRLPKEPCDEKTEGAPVSQLRFRIPVSSSDHNEDEPTSSQNSGFLNRRFLASSEFQTVIDYLTSGGYPSEEFKILSSWPRRDLSQVDSSQTLKDLKLYPQETLTLEEK